MDILAKAKATEQATVAHLLALEQRVTSIVETAAHSRWVYLAAVVIGLAGGFLLGRL